MVIDSFRGDYKWLSNFYVIDIRIDNEVFKSTEHYYQSRKTINSIYRQLIKDAATPYLSAKIGRSKTCPILSEWNLIKDQVMYTALLAKFTQHTNLAEMLKRTGTEVLIEGNTWGDKYWGMVKEDGQWVGENKLGKMLMEIRDILPPLSS